ncbi:fungal-specific transcription factor domain-containing protein [Truncatella angustata]|uniref:Fungal-specific transcription factor domain-containing protein n=1 Tax=Truncatella angustata TaxID=152316 RepID=A0A9P9A5D1_9PEZI|nr:fungal-specific transcription factor domain-containing protein [Truncatella angustata]KAH6661205.1 fungal-specific transcription factor domain-containing protein [Truncatella angustata]
MGPRHGSTPPTAVDSSAEQRGTKRRRVPVACAACRNKKSRCDGQRPKCSSCQVQDLECEYAQTPISSTTPVPKIFLQLVETRLANLENDVRALKRQNRSEAQYSLDDDRGELSHLVVDSSISREELQNTGVSPDATDGVGTIEFTDEENAGYFGQSSNIAFTRNLRRALGRVLTERQNDNSMAQSATASPPQARVRVSRPLSPGLRHYPPVNANHSTSEALRLPPPTEMETLIRKFFGNTGALFPYIHRANFIKTFEDAKRYNFKTCRRSWLGLLNIILAMATGTEPLPIADVSERTIRAETFYSRSKTLCLDLIMSGTSVESVQTMLLMSLYLQGTNRSVKTWNIHGLAVKAAFQLGLHVSDSAWNCSELDREIRNRTWYGCVILDRTLSMTFGRPPAIPENYVRVPLPQICHSSMSRNDSSDNLEIVSAMFFVATIKLYKVMWSIIDTLYACNLGSQPDHNVLMVASNVLQIEQQFLEWQSTLNPELALIQAQEISSDPEYSLTKRLRVILTMRYHNLRILAYRPYLDLYLRNIGRPHVDGSEVLMLKQFGGRNITACFDSAANLIRIVHLITHSEDSLRSLLGAWWFTLYYTLNATLTVMSMLLIDKMYGSNVNMVSDIPSTALLELSEDALSCLPAIDPGNQMVDKCAQVAAEIYKCLELVSTPNSEGDAPSAAETSINQPINSGGTFATGHVQLPVDLSSFGLDWDPDNFMSTLDPDIVDGIRDTDIFF